MNEVLKNKIHVLSQLANVDKDFDIRELSFIYNVCLRHGIPVDAIAEIVAEPYPIITLENLQEHDRIDYMADILSLILIDGKVLPTEIQLCLTMGKRLGFETSSLNTFVLELRDKADVSEEYLRKKVEQLAKIPTA
jgi:hypothetical protein